ncbi:MULTISPECIES: hypothetical protein [Helicobacter]|nr:MULTISPECIES: hypothetical protein [Helicobacter]MDY5949822.1 hypothetical protein [Helicobacter sp.]
MDFLFWCMGVFICCQLFFNCCNDREIKALKDRINKLEKGANNVEAT